MNKIFIICYAGLIFILNGCKVQVSLNGATIPEFAKTVQVDFFENKTSLGPPTMAPLFSETWRDVVSRQTPLKLIKSNGDLVFEGYISDFQITPVAIQGNDKAAQSRLSITVFVKYTCTKQTGQNFEDRFTRFTDFPATDNFQNRQDELMKEVFRQITEDIFNRAFNNW